MVCCSIDLLYTSFADAKNAVVVCKFTSIKPANRPDYPKPRQSSQAKLSQAQAWNTYNTIVFQYNLTALACINSFHRP